MCVRKMCLAFIGWCKHQVWTSLLRFTVLQIITITILSLLLNIESRMIGIKGAKKGIINAFKIAYT